MLVPHPTKDTIKHFCTLHCCTCTHSIIIIIGSFLSPSSLLLCLEFLRTSVVVDLLFYDSPRSLVVLRDYLCSPSASAVEYPSWAPANSLPSYQAERWGEGERAFPLKKRRGSLGETAMLDGKDSGFKKMKFVKSGNARTSKKDARRDDSEEDDDGEFEEGRDQGGGEEKKIVVGIESSGAKKRGRGGVLMEGSRCSRVNGRGWRCCQQTLVGYSLCEHHLGKGRLRSMTSVRSKSKRPNSSSSSRANELLPEERALDPPSKAEGAEDGDEEDDGDIEDKAALKKKVKLGMVKARSMSSLLGQTSSATAIADAP